MKTRIAPRTSRRVQNRDRDKGQALAEAPPLAPAPLVPAPLVPAPLAPASSFCNRAAPAQRGFRGLWVADVAPALSLALSSASASHESSGGVTIVTRAPQLHAFNAFPRASDDSSGVTVVLACSGCDAVVQRVGGVVFFEAALTQPLVAWCHTCLAA